MEIKKFRVGMYIIVAISIILSAVSYYLAQITSPLLVLSLPIDGVATILRRLSLSSRMGDVMAWILYIIIGLMPMIILCIGINFTQRKKKNTQESKTKTIKGIAYEIKQNIEFTDMLLVGLSVYLFFLLYVFINPATLVGLMPQIDGGNMAAVAPVLRTILAGVAYALLVGYIILKVASSLENTDIWKKTESILMVGTIIYVAYICYVMPFELFALTQQNYFDLNTFMTIGKALFKLLPMICFVGIMEAGIMLIHALKENKYDGQAAKLATLMANRSKNTVIISVFCNITMNLIQVMLIGELKNTSYLIDIPFLPLMLAFIGLIATEYLKESELLYNENKMII